MSVSFIVIIMVMYVNQCLTFISRTMKKKRKRKFSTKPSNNYTHLKSKFFLLRCCRAARNIKNSHFYFHILSVLIVMKTDVTCVTCQRNHQLLLLSITWDTHRYMHREGNVRACEHKSSYVPFIFHDEISISLAPSLSIFDLLLLHSLLLLLLFFPIVIIR